MELTETRRGGVTIFALSGQVETHGLPALSDQVEKVIGDGRVRLCINCSGIEFINSTGIGYFVTVAKKLRGMEGDLVLSEPSRFMEATARTLELHHIFEIMPDDDAAIEYLQRGAV